MTPRYTLAGQDNWAARRQVMSDADRQWFYGPLAVETYDPRADLLDLLIATPFIAFAGWLLWSALP